MRESFARFSGLLLIYKLGKDLYDIHKDDLKNFFKDKPQTLHYAAYKNDPKKLKQLFEQGNSLTELNDKWETPLDVAAQNGSDDVVKTIIELHKDHNSPYYQSALASALKAALLYLNRHLHALIAIFFTISH